MTLVDDEEDGFVSSLAFLQSLDKSLQVCLSLVEGSGDEFLPHGDGVFLAAADV